MHKPLNFFNIPAALFAAVGLILFGRFVVLPERWRRRTYPVTHSRSRLLARLGANAHAGVAADLLNQPYPNGSFAEFAM